MAKIKKISKEEFKGKVYNIETQKNHNYFANGILIHNCYMDSKPDSKHFDNIVEKADKLFGNMSENERPFQIACAGGEPTLHPDFIPFIKKVRYD